MWRIEIDEKGKPHCTSSSLQSGVEGEVFFSSSKINNVNCDFVWTKRASRIRFFMPGIAAKPTPHHHGLKGTQRRRSLTHPRRGGGILNLDSIFSPMEKILIIFQWLWSQCMTARSDSPRSRTITGAFYEEGSRWDTVTSRPQGSVRPHPRKPFPRTALLVQSNSWLLIGSLRHTMTAFDRLID